MYYMYVHKYTMKIMEICMEKQENQINIWEVFDVHMSS